MPWYPICALFDVPPGSCAHGDAGGEDVLVVNLDGELYAMSNICTHEYAELSEGELEGDELVCPLHQARFDVRTGEALTPPAYEGLATFAVRVVSDNVEVEVDD